jgi:ABC-type transporter Mla subunit MlaD
VSPLDDNHEHRGINTDRLKLEIRRASAPFVLLILLFIGGLLALADIIDKLHGVKPWKSYVHYQLAFSSLKGVVPGRVPLRLAGVDAGAVTKTELINGQAVMTIELQKQYAPLYKNAQMRIRPVTPLEDEYVDITTRGTKSAGVPPKGFVFPATQDESEVGIGNVLDAFDPVTRQRLATTLDELGSALPDKGAALNQAFVQLGPFLATANDFSKAINTQHVALAKLVHNFGTITHTLALRDTQLSKFVMTTEQTLTSLAQNDTPFNATLSALPPLLSNLQSSFAALQSSEQHIDPALTALKPVASALPAGLNSLRTFSVQATPALRALQPSVRSLTPFAAALQPTTSTLTSNITNLQTEAPQLDRITTSVVPCEFIIDRFLNNVPTLLAWNDSVDGNNYNAVPRADVVTSPDELADTTHFGTRIAPPCFAPGGFKGP